MLRNDFREIEFNKVSEVERYCKLEGLDYNYHIVQRTSGSKCPEGSKAVRKGSIGKLIKSILQGVPSA